MNHVYLPNFNFLSYLSSKIDHLYSIWYNCRLFSWIPLWIKIPQDLPKRCSTRFASALPKRLRTVLHCFQPGRYQVPLPPSPPRLSPKTTEFLPSFPHFWTLSNSVKLWFCIPKTRISVQICGSVCYNHVSPLSEPPFQAEQTEEMSGPLVDSSKWPIIIPSFEVKGSFLNCQKDIERHYLMSFAHKKKNLLPYLFPGFANRGLSRHALLLSCSPQTQNFALFFLGQVPSASWWLEL